MPRGFGFGRRGLWCRRFAMLSWIGKGNSNVQNSIANDQLSFNAKQFGYGYNRIIKAIEVGDPERAMFGLGPCGELAYQEYKKRKSSEKQES